MFAAPCSCCAVAIEKTDDRGIRLDVEAVRLLAGEIELIRRIHLLSPLDYERACRRGALNHELTAGELRHSLSDRPVRVVDLDLPAGRLVDPGATLANENQASGCDQQRPESY